MARNVISGALMALLGIISIPTHVRARAVAMAGSYQNFYLTKPASSRRRVGAAFSASRNAGRSFSSMIKGER